MNFYPISLLKITHFDAHDHGHSLTNLDDSWDFAGPRTLPNLNLHPTLEIVSKEICCHGVYHINLTIIKSILVKLGGISQEIINIKGVLCLWINPLVNNMITHGSATEIFSRNIRRQSGLHGFLNSKRCLLTKLQTWFGTCIKYQHLSPPPLFLIITL